MLSSVDAHPFHEGRSSLSPLSPSSSSTLCLLSAGMKVHLCSLLLRLRLRLRLVPAPATKASISYDFSSSHLISQRIPILDFYYHGRYRLLCRLHPQPLSLSLLGCTPYYNVGFAENLAGFLVSWLFLVGDILVWLGFSELPIVRAEGRRGKERLVGLDCKGAVIGGTFF